MNIQQKRQDRNLVCTCNEIYIQDIQAELDVGTTDENEIMYGCGGMFRCGECKPHISHMIKQSQESAEDAT